MADFHTCDSHASCTTGRTASGVYMVIDILDRIWRKYQRTLDTVVLKWDAHRG